MREAVVKILAEYEEGEAYIKPLVKKHGIAWGSFRRVLEQNPDLQSEYERIQHWRGEVYREKAIEIGTGVNADPRCARVAAETLERAAASYNKRFNPRITVEHEVGPNILSAMAEASLRLPPRDLAPGIIDVTPSFQPQIANASPDCLSVAPDSDDPFAD